MTLSAIIVSTSHNILFVIFLVSLYNFEQYKRNDKVKALEVTAILAAIFNVDRHGLKEEYYRLFNKSFKRLL